MANSTRTGAFIIPFLSAGRRPSVSRRRSPVGRSKPNDGGSVKIYETRGKSGPKLISNRDAYPPVG